MNDKFEHLAMELRKKVAIYKVKLGHFLQGFGFLSFDSNGYSMYDLDKTDTF